MEKIAGRPPGSENVTKVDVELSHSSLRTSIATRTAMKCLKQDMQIKTTNDLFAQLVEDRVKFIEIPVSNVERVAMQLKCNDGETIPQMIRRYLTETGAFELPGEEVP